MALTDFVRTQISVQISAITRAGFGTMLFVYEGTAAANRVTQYGNIDEIAADFATTDPAYKAGEAFFGGDLVSPFIKIGYKLSTETWSEALDACVAADPDFYAVAIDSAVEADILEVAAWVQPRTRLFFAKSADAGILDPLIDTDVASVLTDLERGRTALFYHSLAASAYPEMAWAGGQLPKTPGSTTWAFKRAPGIPADSFTSSQVTALKAKRVNYTENVAGLTRVFGGYTSRPGIFVDITRGLDYVTQRMNEDVFILLTSQDKVPGDDRGSAMVESVIWARINQSVAEDIFIDDESLTVFVPSFNERDIADRANRLLTGCKFTANLAGAIHEVEIIGEVRA